MHRRLPPLPVVMFTLLAVLLSCALPGRRSPVEPEPGFSTATPGGSISISLLTPTAPGDPALATLAPGQTTPIGPIATATAIAAAVNAATATAQALEARTFYPPATCPDLGNPVMSERPTTFEDYPEAIAEYLSLGGPPTILEATLRKWYETDMGGQAIAGRDFGTAGGLVRADRDFNADTVPEVLIVLPDPGSTRYPPAGDLFLFGCQDAVYRLLFRVGYSPDRSVPFIISADDLIGSGYDHLVYVTETCDAATCTKEISVQGWSLTLGTFANMAAGVITVPGRLAEGLGASVTDTSGDGIREIIASAGVDTSLEAGPPRPSTQVWAWDGEAFEVSQTITSQAVYRIHVIHDGDAALERGEFEQAAEYYLLALNDPGLQSWPLTGEGDYLRAYALYRLMLTYAVQYDQTQAGAYFDELLARYPPFGFPTEEEGEGEEGEEGNPPPGGPGGVYAELAMAFWDVYLANSDHGMGCQAAISFAESRPDVLMPLNSYGYANRHYTARDLCPFVSQ